MLNRYTADGVESRHAVSCVRARQRVRPAYQICSSASSVDRGIHFPRIYTRAAAWSTDMCVCVCVCPREIPSQSSQIYICIRRKCAGDPPRARVRVHTRVKSRFLSRTLKFTASFFSFFFSFFLFFMRRDRAMGRRTVNRPGRRPNISRNFSLRVRRHVRGTISFLSNEGTTIATKRYYADIENDDGRPRDCAHDGVPAVMGFFLSQRKSRRRRAESQKQREIAARSL